MLSDIDRKVLDVVSQKLLITKGEINGMVGGNGAADVSISRLKEMGYIDKVESLGTSFVITQKGIRAVKEI